MSSLAMKTRWVERLRRQPRLCRIPAIAVTADAMVTEQQRFLEAGCNACVSKPVSFKLLSEHQGTVASPPRKMPSTR